MLWVAAFLAFVIWVLGLASDFLGLRIHLFLLFAILCGLAALLPGRTASDNEARDKSDAPADTNAKSMPAAEDEQPSEGREPAAIE